MQTVRQALRRTYILLGLIFSFVAPVLAAEGARAKAQDYLIDAEIEPQTHQLTARVRVKFLVTGDTNFASFELNNALRITKILDANGKALSVERIPQDNVVRVALPNGLNKGDSSSITFEYEGKLANADDSPVEGLKLAYVGEDVTYLLYPGRWFPITNYGMDRFTAIIHITAPAGTIIIGSGLAAAAQPASAKKNVATFSWQKPSFPGTIIAGPFVEADSGNVRVFVHPNKKQYAAAYAETAGKELEYFSGMYGVATTPFLRVVELPDDTVPAWWAPEIAAIAGHDIQEKTNYRLLADTIAHQWWGVSVSPASKDDLWLADGGARYSEMRYVQNSAGQQAFEDATKDMAVGALAYDTVPLSSISKLDLFSPQFQALATDKGGMIFHMLRWVIGDAAFDKSMKEFMDDFRGKPASVADLEAIAEKNSGETLTTFFSQWIDGTGAPEFKLKHTISRTDKGFRIVGQISQDLDLFRMPLELKVDTDGQSEMKRIEVTGTQSSFSVETFGQPRRLTLDPNNWVLKYSPDLHVRVAIRRGQELTAQGDLAGSLSEFNKALEINKKSSLAHYRKAEVFYLQRNYQSAANEYRESINGDDDPRWTEVWSHIGLGKIFDIVGQRERAVNEYRQAIQTNDNTQGALDEARRYLETPYQR
ncbi:MAG TPA: M1 family aminopeptidase [Terriglobales bacterium]|nr:M1 family aminopeptidase [Terriglobales bacterium]